MSLFLDCECVPTKVGWPNRNDYYFMQSVGCFSCLKGWNVEVLQLPRWGRCQTKNIHLKLLKMAIFGDRKVIHNSVKHLFLLNEMFLKTYNVTYFWGRNGFYFGYGLSWSCFCLQSVLEEQFLKVLQTFSQYITMTQVIDNDSNYWYT